VKIGFVGAGGIANAHADALKTIPDAKIVAVTDMQPAQAASFAEKTGARTYDSVKALLSDAGVDALYIVVPPFAHGEAERAAIEAKVPFFIEKPVDVDEGRMNELAKEIAQSGLMTSAGYMTRYRKSVQRAREVFANDPPILAYGGWWGGTPGKHSWWIDKKKSGGQFHEQVTHTVDLARYLFGEPAEVFAFAATGFNKNLEGYSMDDAVTVAIHFKNGGIANLMSSVSSNAGGALFMNIHSLGHNVKFSEWDHRVIITAKDGEPEEIAGEPNIFAIEDQVFVDAVRTGDRGKIRSDYADAAKSAALSLAANRSIETGKPVSF